jgi:hypothetical protein
LADPETLAVEFLKTGMEGSTAVKTELYVQVLKQLTDNPNINSEVKGWEMLALMLSCFAPPEIFENFVAMFIRKNVSPSLAPSVTSPSPLGSKDDPSSLPCLPSLQHLRHSPLLSSYRGRA